MTKDIIYQDPQSLLSRVSITSLSQFIGNERSLWLNEMGVSIDQASLAALSIVESGIGFLEVEQVRNEILFSLGFDTKVIESFKDFKIGRNKTT